MNRDIEKLKVMGLRPNLGSSIDFGFGEQTRQKRVMRGKLEDIYEFWRKNPSKANLARLLDASQPVLNKALTTYAGGDKAYMGRARKLAINAFKTFDPKRGAKLNTHLMIQLQPLRRAYTQRTAGVSVPERVQMDRMRLERAEQELTEQLGREPADTELADYTGLSRKRIAHVRSFARGILREGQLITPEHGLQLPGASKVTADDIWAEYVYHDLNPIDKKIMEWKLGIFGKKVRTTSDIARRLGISASAVSQRAAKIAAKLEHPYAA